MPPPAEAGDASAAPPEEEISLSRYLEEICLHWDVPEYELERALLAVEYRLQCNRDTLQEMESEARAPQLNLRRLYRRVEYLLISLRATVDVLLHLIVLVQNLRIPPGEVTLGRVLSDSALGADIRRILRHYTRREHGWWRFIADTRNEVTHQTTIMETYPIQVEEDHTLDPPVLSLRFQMPSGERPDLIAHYRRCVSHIQELAEAILHSLAAGMR